MVENWNSANGFVFFGKGGEIASNRVTDQEVSALALHLVQASMVYVSKRMVKSVLRDPVWKDRMRPEDFRGLTPLIYSHINPRVEAGGKKLHKTIAKLEDYAISHKIRLIDYGARQSRGKRVSTALVEGGAEFIVNACMAKGQHMRWSNRGAFQLLQARTADINGLLERHFLAA